MEPNSNALQKYRGLNKSVPAARRFTELETYKSNFLNTVRECSALTKPLVVPPSGYTPGNPLLYPRSSHGGRLVSNLVSQLLLILFPPGIPFFKSDLESVDVREMSKGLKLPDGKTMYDALRETFVTIENNCAIILETEDIREKLRMILLQIVVAGNSCFLERDLDLSMLPLEDWVCTRSSAGDLLELIFREYVPLVEDDGTPGLEDRHRSDGYFIKYTRCYRRDKGMWTVEEFVDSQESPFRSVQVKLGDEWWYVPTWELTSGEDYARGAVEESLGDIRTYESGTRIVNESATALAKVIFLVRPNALTQPKDVASAENTEIIIGDSNDVGVIQANKVYDMSGFISFLNGIKQELDVAFMMPSVLRREAERVTAEEIRRMAAEFEKSRGGTYNSLSSQIQAPIARLLLKILFDRGTLSQGKITINDILPIVTTGLQGLGRSLELENLLMFLRDFIGMSPENIQRINQDQLASRLASLRGVEVTKLLKSPEELAQEQQDMATDELARTVGPDLIKQGALPNE